MFVIKLDIKSSQAININVFIKKECYNIILPVYLQFPKNKYYEHPF